LRRLYNTREKPEHFIERDLPLVNLYIYIKKFEKIIGGPIAPLEKLLKSIKKRDRNVLEPLSKIWSMTKSERDAVGKEDEEAASSFIEITHK